MRKIFFNSFLLIFIPFFSVFVVMHSFYEQTVEDKLKFLSLTLKLILEEEYIYRNESLIANLLDNIIETNEVDGVFILKRKSGNWIFDKESRSLEHSDFNLSPSFYEKVNLYVEHNQSFVFFEKNLSFYCVKYATPLNQEEVKILILAKDLAVFNEYYFHYMFFSLFLIFYILALMSFTKASMKILLEKDFIECMVNIFKEYENKKNGNRL